MNQLVRDKLEGWFHDQMRLGKFPMVEWKENKEIGMHGYNMMEYSHTWSKLSAVVHESLKSVGHEHGIFQNARNSSYLMAVDSAIASLTEERVLAQEQRFKTMFD
jgi:hypothetical protein